MNSAGEIGHLSANSAGQKVGELVREIDLVIRNLGDNAPVIVNSRKRKHRTSSSNASTSTETNEPDAQSQNVFAPVGLERQYVELYSLLEKGLIGVEQDGRIKKTNVSALLMGARGQGKSLVLGRCLLALRQKAATMQKNQNIHQNKKSAAPNAAHFRVVNLNGILLRGQNVTIVVQEIVSQLCEIVAEETHMKLHHNEHKNLDEDADTDADADNIQQKLHSLIQKETHRFRTRQTTFNSSMACLNEAFQISCIDSIPILIVLDELDSFLPKKNARMGSNPSSLGRQSSGGASELGVSSSSRDLLLYHLLDRIAGKGSLISLVGVCARLTTTSSYEKRVRSRAQGTSKVVYFNSSKEDDESATSSNLYTSLVNMLMSNFDVLGEDKFMPTRDGLVGDTDHSNLRFSEHLKNRVKCILLPQLVAASSEDGPIDEKVTDEKYKIHDIFKLNRECGKTIRWFCRVLSVALTLYVAKVQKSHNGSIPVFNQSYVLEGLKVMEADSFISEPRPITAGCEAPKGDLFEVTPRLQDLMDLSGSQVAVLLSAKRILKRDCQIVDERLPSKPLTYERIRKEYESYFLAQRKSSGPDRYDESVFFTAFQQILGGMIFPAKDHTGGGPNQYYFSRKFTAGGMQQQLLKKTPLHLGFHIDRDLMIALSADKLKCSTALKDWAK